MKNFYLQTLEGAPRFGEVTPSEVSRDELNTYFDVCLESHSEDPTTGAERIVSALEDVANAYGIEEVPVVFWHVRNMGRTGYLAIDIWNERHPEETEEENTMQNQEVNIDTQLVTSGHEYTIIDETEDTISYVDETGAMHVEQKQKSGLGWLVAAAAAFFFLT